MREIEDYSNRGYVRSRIWLLRRKIEKDPRYPVYIQTERGVGYRFENAQNLL